jgi:transposase
VKPCVVVILVISVNLQQNLSIHATEEVRQVSPLFFPYSPDYNPIELSFSVLKAWMKRNWIFLRQSCDISWNSLYEKVDVIALQDSKWGICLRKHLEQYEVDHSIEL